MNKKQRQERKKIIRAHKRPKTEKAFVENTPEHINRGLQFKMYDRQDYAGFWRRIFADWIDGVILAIACMLLLAIQEDLAKISGLLILAAYHIGFKAIAGSTPGYKMLRIKIVAMDGAQATVNQIVVRQVSSIFSSLVFSLGFLWIAFDANKQAWHDKIAGTYVVRTKASPARTITIPRTRMIRVGLFALGLLATSAFIIGSYVAVSKLEKVMRGSEAFHFSQDYLRSNSWIQQKVGKPIRFDPVNWSLSWSGEHSTSTIHALGDRGEIDIWTSVDKIGDRWEMTEAGYNDDKGNYIDITQPLVRKNVDARVQNEAEK